MGEGNFNFKAWYRMNADMLNTGRRVRYRIDRDYRERILETNRRSREGKRESLRRDRRAQGIRKSAVDIPPHKTFIFDGVEFMTIGFLASFLSRCIQTVRAWERRGVIPEASRTSPRGDRLYSLQEAKLIQKKLKQLGLLQKHRDQPIRRTVFRVRNKRTGKVKKTQLFSVAVCAKACDRTVVSITSFEKKEVIPPTPFRYGKASKRLYSDPMITALREAFIESGGDIRAPEIQSMFKILVRDAWENLGVFDLVLAE